MTRHRCMMLLSGHSVIVWRHLGALAHWWELQGHSKRKFLETPFAQQYSCPQLPSFPGTRAQLSQQVREEWSAIGNTLSITHLIQSMNRSEPGNFLTNMKCNETQQVSHMGKLKKKGILEEEEAAKHRVKLREGRTLAR